MLPTVCFYNDYVIHSIMKNMYLCGISCSDFFVLCTNSNLSSSDGKTKWRLHRISESQRVCSKINLDVLLMYWKTLEFYVYFQIIDLFASTKYCNRVIPCQFNPPKRQIPPHPLQICSNLVHRVIFAEKAEISSLNAIRRTVHKLGHAPFLQFCRTCQYKNIHISVTP